MGRNCGWLTAATAFEYTQRLQKKKFVPSILANIDRWGIDALYIPELNINLEAEAIRLRKLLDQKDSINIFLSEGACIENIMNDMENDNKLIKRDAFGHIRLDEINPGKWFAKQFSKIVCADKVLIQKSGYFARSSKPNKKDLDLIIKTADMAVECAINKKSGVIGLDEECNNKLTCIDFDRIRGGKPFNIKQNWFQLMHNEINNK